MKVPWRNNAAVRKYFISPIRKRQKNHFIQMDFFFFFSTIMRASTFFLLLKRRNYILAQSSKSGLLETNHCKGMWLMGFPPLTFVPHKGVHLNGWETEQQLPPAFLPKQQRRQSLIITFTFSSMTCFCSLRCAGCCCCGGKKRS